MNTSLTFSKPFLFSSMYSSKRSDLKKLTSSEPNSVMRQELIHYNTKINARVVTAASNDHKIRGWGMVNDNRLVMVFVNEEYRKMGVGRQIIQTLLDYYKPARLYVMPPPEQFLLFNWIQSEKENLIILCRHINNGDVYKLYRDRDIGGIGTSTLTYQTKFE